MEIITKPRIKLIGQDGNIFNLMGIASKALRQSGLKSESTEMENKIFNSGSYNEALSIIRNYCEVE